MIRFSFLLCLSFLVSVPANAQQTFKGTDKIWTTDLFEALDEAIERTEGDILIFFFHRDDDRTDRIANHLLNNELMHQFMEDNYSTVAIEIGSPQWERLQKRYRPGSPADWPHIVIDVRKFLSHGEFHGWENGMNLEEHLEMLRLMKNQGAVQGDVRQWTPAGQSGL